MKKYLVALTVFSFLIGTAYAVVADATQKKQVKSAKVVKKASKPVAKSKTKK